MECSQMLTEQARTALDLFWADRAACALTQRKRRRRCRARDHRIRPCRSEQEIALAEILDVDILEHQHILAGIEPDVVAVLFQRRLDGQRADVSIGRRSDLRHGKK